MKLLNIGEDKDINFKLNIDGYFNRLNYLIDRLDKHQITTVIEKLIDAYHREAFIYIFGNGGNAATASHFVNDFNKGISEGLEKKFRFLCLNDNVPSMMAIANDIHYDQIFKFQLENFLTKNDLVIAISRSGNAQNIINAIEYANFLGVETIGLVGADGGRLKKIVKWCIHIPAYEMQKIEDIQMIMNHLMMNLIKKYLKG